MMKWISILVSMLFGGGGSKSTSPFNIRETANEILDDISVRLRKPVALVLLGQASIILTCGGLFIAVLDAARQYDTQGTVYSTATLWSGIGIAAICLAGYIYTFLHAWPGIKERRHKEAERKAAEAKRPPELSDALSLLVMDHIDERRARRAARAAARTGTSATTSSSTTTTHTEKHATGHQQPPGPTGFA